MQSSLRLRARLHGAGGRHGQRGLGQVAGREHRPAVAVAVAHQVVLRSGGDGQGGGGGEGGGSGGLS